MFGQLAGMLLRTLGRRSLGDVGFSRRTDWAKFIPEKCRDSDFLLWPWEHIYLLLSSQLQKGSDERLRRWLRVSMSNIAVYLLISRFTANSLWAQQASVLLINAYALSSVEFRDWVKKLPATLNIYLFLKILIQHVFFWDCALRCPRSPYALLKELTGPVQEFDCAPGAVHLNC